MLGKPTKLYAVIFAVILMMVSFSNFFYEPPRISLAQIQHREGLHTVHLKYDQHLYANFASMAKQKLHASNKQLVRLVRKLIDPPSVRPFYPVDNSWDKKWTPTAEVAYRLLNNKTDGFFIEVGAYDGVTASNTVHLEQEKRWKGLLIEADPDLYVLLRGHNRRAWSINAAIGIFDYATIMPFWPEKGQGGKLNMKNKSKISADAKTQDMTNRMKVPKLGLTSGTKLPMIPLESLLLALNQTSIDFFSLDVEGFELQVLQTIPFEKVDIKVLAVEFLHGTGDAVKEYTKFMAVKGYRQYCVLKYTDPPIYVNDIIFVKKELNKPLI